MAEGIINVSVANLYEEGAYRSQVVSQVLLGEGVKIHERRKNFSLVESADGYSGWVSNYQLEADRNYSGRAHVCIRKHWVGVFRDPDAGSERLRDAVIGSRLIETGSDGDWIGVELPDGTRGWLHSTSTGRFPGQDRDGILSLAREFLGCPYFWGGRSPKGFDCSGLIQTVYGLLGIQLPRDSWMQHDAGRQVSDARPGDLCFFAESGERITHVGILLGEGRVLHARGYVRVNSLISGNPDYSSELESTFVDNRSFLSND